jgi:CDP-diacylglycerol--glycerol-3-phosphate 3-phosphatidyltransferase
MAELFTPLARILHRLGVSANAVTILGCVLSVGGAVLIALSVWPVGIALALVGGFADGVDGLLARHAQRATRFGAFLDSVLDRWSDSAFFVGLLIYFGRADMLMEEVLSALALSFSLLVSYTRARAEGVGAQCSRGLFTRLERFTVLMAGLILDQVTIALWVIVILSAFTAIQRIHHTWRYMQLNLEE